MCVETRVSQQLCVCGGGEGWILQTQRNLQDNSLLKASHERREEETKGQRQHLH